MKLAKFFLIFAVIFCTGCSQNTSSSVSSEVYAMDTVMYLTAYGDQAEAAIAEAESALYDLENQISRTRETSDIFTLNQTGAATLTQQSATLLATALDYGVLTHGAFSCTIAPVVDVWGFTTENAAVPTPEALEAAMALIGDDTVELTGTTATLAPGQAIDLGGIGKGYASQLVADIFAQYDLDHATVSLGGNVYVQGGRTDGEPWHIGVQDPQDISTYAGVLTMSDGFAVTSGGYQRYFEEDGQLYHHIIDPATGYPADSGLLSVTIISPDNGTLCDALSTALFVMGEDDAIAFWRSGLVDFEMILLTQDGRVVVSAGLDGQFTPEDGYSYECVS